MVLLFGVAIFSYIMGNFITIIDEIKTFGSSFDDGDNLSKFFGLLIQFNHGKGLNIKFKMEMENYFDYKWEHDRNQAMVGNDTILLEQLPKDVQRKIYSNFLFRNFLNKFRKFFSFENNSSPL